jgi:hypothetical protein
MGALSTIRTILESKFNDTSNLSFEHTMVTSKRVS